MTLSAALVLVFILVFVVPPVCALLDTADVDADVAVVDAGLKLNGLTLTLTFIFINPVPAPPN